MQSGKALKRSECNALVDELALATDPKRCAELIAKLRAEGVTDYIALPLLFTDGAVTSDGAVLFLGGRVAGFAARTACV